jgi:hypothetical protein
MQSCLRARISGPFTEINLHLFRVVLNLLHVLLSGLVSILIFNSGISLCLYLSANLLANSKRVLASLPQRKSHVIEAKRTLNSR